MQDAAVAEIFHLVGGVDAAQCGEGEAGAVLARDLGAGKLTPRTVTKSSGRVRSARISDQAWEALKAESQRLGIVPSQALVGLAEEYADGLISIRIDITTSQHTGEG